MTTVTLQAQIDEKRREIHTEGYPMSVGELVNLYRDGDLDIHPEFQRIFRWSKLQKSRFIESLLLGIPIPSLFVYQRHDGVWDVIDGLQRLSTIFEFMGILKDHNGNDVAASALVGTDYLPELEGKIWENGGAGLEADQQRLIKRAALDIKIVKRESDDRSKYDLFERLNTGGSLLTDQEVRNSLMIMSNQEHYQWIISMRDNDDFKSTIGLSDRSLFEQYDLELLLRFLMIKDLQGDQLSSIGDMKDFLNRAVLKHSESDDYKTGSDREDFSSVFKIINDSLEDSAFRRYDRAKGRSLGGFSVAAFEAVTLGVYANLDEWKNETEDDAKLKLRHLVENLWTQTGFTNHSGSGFRASQRIPKIVPFARGYFKP